MATKSQRLLFRYLQLNHRSPRNKDGTKASAPPPVPPPPFPALQVLFDTAWKKYATVGSRHVPALKNGVPETGQRYIVPLKRKVHGGSGAVLLRMCVYTAGETPAFAPSDLGATEASVDYKEVVNEDGKQLAPSIEFSVLMLGKVVLIQNRAGAGAAKAVQKAVYWFGRQIFGPKFVMPDFLQVAPKSFAKEIENGGGIAAVTFGIAQSDPKSGTALPLDQLYAIEDRLGGDRTQIRVSASGDGVLDAQESISLLEDPDDEGMSNVRLHLKNGGTITGEQMAMSKPVDVSLVHGVPDCDEVDNQLLDYLKELQGVDSDGEQSVTGTGQIGARLKIITVAKKP